MLTKKVRNIGSISKMRIVDQDDVETMPDAFEGSLLGTVILKVDKAWEPIYFTRDSAHFVESPDGANHGLMVKFRSPKDQATSLADLVRVRKKRWIVEFTDLNGIVKVAGAPGEGCAVMMELRDNGQNKRDSNHYNCLIMLTREHPVPILQG